MNDALRATYDEVPYEATRSRRRTRTAASSHACSACGRTPSRVPRAGTRLRHGGNLIPMAESLPDASSSASTCPPGRSTDGQAADRRARADEHRAAARRHPRRATRPTARSTTSSATACSRGCRRTVQDKILADLRARTCPPNGIAYVSYNTYPGWHMRGHDPRHDAVPRRAGSTTRRRASQQARALLDFLANSRARRTARTPCC